MQIIRTRRRAIALMGLAAALALPVAAQAHDDGHRGPAATMAADGTRSDADGARPIREAAHAARPKGPSAAQLAAKLDRETATVAAAMKAAHGQVRGIADRDARTTAFEAAVAVQLGLPADTVAAAFTAVRADTLTACVARLLAQGAVDADAASAITAKITAGDLDGAHADIRAAKEAHAPGGGSRR